MRVKRNLGSKRPVGSSDGLTRVQAERELRRRIMEEIVVPRTERRTLHQVGEEWTAILPSSQHAQRAGVPVRGGSLPKSRYHS